MATNTPDYVQIRNEFKQLKSIFDQLKGSLPHVSVLSMGMSGDMDSAIAEGATIVRIGTAIFGTRPV